MEGPVTDDIVYRPTGKSMVMDQEDNRGNLRVPRL